jgi:hypothetical protein
MVSVARCIWRVQLLAIELLALVSCGHHPDWDRLEAQGNEIVRVVEVYRSAHGEYPPSLTTAGTQPRRRQHGANGRIIAATKAFTCRSEIMGATDSSYTTALMSVERAARSNEPSNQSMKPTAPFRNKFSVFATTPCRGLSLSR